MEPVVFHNSTVWQHPLFRDCGNSMNEVSKRDYPNKNYFDAAIECLDLDTYEIQVCHGQPDCTVDAVIGIKDYDRRRMTNPRLLLIEFRMSYESARSLSLTKLSQKVNHSRHLLGASLPIHPESIFVFSDAVAPEARHKIAARSQEGGGLQSFIVYSVQEFNQNVKSPDQLPYVPVYKKEAIAKELKLYVERSDWRGFIVKIQFWKTQLEKLRYRNSYEYNHLRDVIKTVWEEFRAKKYPLSDDEELDAEILEEDLAVFFE